MNIYKLSFHCYVILRVRCNKTVQTNMSVSDDVNTSDSDDDMYYNPAINTDDLQHPTFKTSCPIYPDNLIIISLPNTLPWPCVCKHVTTESIKFTAIGAPVDFENIVFYCKHEYAELATTDKIDKLNLPEEINKEARQYIYEHTKKILSKYDIHIPSTDKDDEKSSVSSSVHVNNETKRRAVTVSSNEAPLYKIEFSRDLDDHVTETRSLFDEKAKLNNILTPEFKKRVFETVDNESQQTKKFLNLADSQVVDLTIFSEQKKHEVDKICRTWTSEYKKNHKGVVIKGIYHVITRDVVIEIVRVVKNFSSIAECTAFLRSFQGDYAENLNNITLEILRDAKAFTNRQDDFLKDD